jgi:tRNA A37 threonylcarbamoyladenosine dehydratase
MAIEPGAEAVRAETPATAMAGPTSSDAAHARRFGGLDRLYGVAGAAAIRNSHIVVVGIGGVGSWSVEALARCGVGRLTLIDLDHVAESNINRQIHAIESTLGQSKVEAMRERIASINPQCQVFVIDDFVEPANWSALAAAAETVQGPIDGLIDACDQLKAKLVMTEWARSRRSTAFITVGAAGGKRHAHRVEIDDLALTTHDPLLAQLRHRLRKAHGASRDGKKMKVTCVFSRESVAAPDASCTNGSDGTLNCSGYGSVVSVTATFGQCAAGWIIERIAAAKTL